MRFGRPLYYRLTETKQTLAKALVLDMSLPGTLRSGGATARLRVNVPTMWAILLSFYAYYT